MRHADEGGTQNAAISISSCALAVPPATEGAAINASAETQNKAPWSQHVRAAAGTLLFSWLAPSTTAQRTAALPLFLAWLVHFISAVAGVCLIVVLISWAESNYGGPADVVAQLGALFEELLEEARGNGPLFAASALGIVALVEGVHFGVGLLLMPWGAKDEPLSRSLGHSLRQTWLHTSHFLAGILVIGGVALFFEYLDRQWRIGHPQPAFPTMLTAPVPPADPNDAAAQAEYQAALAEHTRQLNAAQANWSQQWMEWRSQRPWYLSEPEPVIAGTVMGTLLWILAALLCAVAAARRVPNVGGPPLCTGCGYNLLTIPMEGRCPECGQAVASSLGSDAQRGLPWERRGHLGTVAGWWNTAFLVIRRPTESGRRLRVVEPRGDHRRFFAMHLPVVGVIAALAVFAVVASQGSAEFWRYPLITLTMPFVIALLCILGTIGVALFGSFATGLGLSVRSKRNLMPAAAQMACYLAPFLVLWELVGATLILSAAFLEENHRFFSAVEAQTGMYADLAIFLYAGLPNIMLGLLYLALIHRGTAAAQFANR